MSQSCPPVKGELPDIVYEPKQRQFATTFFTDICSVSIPLEKDSTSRSFVLEPVSELKAKEQSLDISIPAKHCTFILLEERPTSLNDKLYVEIAQLSRELDWLEYLERKVYHMKQVIQNKDIPLSLTREIQRNPLSDTACRERNRQEYMFLKSVLDA